MSVIVKSSRSEPSLGNQGQPVLGGHAPVPADFKFRPVVGAGRVDYRARARFWRAWAIILSLVALMLLLALLKSGR